MTTKYRCGYCLNEIRKLTRLFGNKPKLISEIIKETRDEYQEIVGFQVEPNDYDLLLLEKALKRIEKEIGI